MARDDARPWGSREWYELHGADLEFHDRRGVPAREPEPIPPDVLACAARNVGDWYSQPSAAPDDIVDERMVARLLDMIIDSELCNTDALVIRRRMRGATLEDVGVELGVCRERIRQRYAKAVRKLRRRLCMWSVRHRNLNPRDDAVSMGLWESWRRMGLEWA